MRKPYTAPPPDRPTLTRRRAAARAAATGVATYRFFFTAFGFAFDFGGGAAWVAASRVLRS